MSVLLNAFEQGLHFSKHFFTMFLSASGAALGAHLHAKRVHLA